jgi:hypothetical protein
LADDLLTSAIENQQTEGPAMPLELQIIRAAEFVKVGAHGQFDLAASKQALAALAGACRNRGIDLAMLDLRDLRPGPQPVFTRADLVALLSTFPEVGFGQHQRLAILYHSDPHKRARLFAFLSSMHGWAVQAFGEFDKAVLWLSRGQKPRMAQGRLIGEKDVPVRVGKTTAFSSAGHPRVDRSQKKRSTTSLN